MFTDFEKRDIIWAVLERDKLPCVVLKKLISDKSEENWEVRVGVADEEIIPEECFCDIFEELARDISSNVRYEVAGTKNIPKECACDIYKELKNDYNKDVLDEIKRNPIFDWCR